MQYRIAIVFAIAAAFTSCRSLCAQTAETEPPKPAVSWKDGRTTFQFANAGMVLSNRIQIRASDLNPDEGESKASFRVRRTETKLDGWIYRPNLTFEVLLDFSDNGSIVQDANINYAVSRAFQIQAGQLKVPFGRQEMTSSTLRQFVDRSIVSAEFAKGRDQGVQLWGSLARDTIEWRAGAFNGNGRNKPANDNGEFQYNARVTYQPFGDVRYSESDFESKAHPLFALAAQYEKNDQHGATGGNDSAREIFGGDVVFKFRGLSLFGEYFDRTSEFELGEVVDADGFHAQVGYFVIPTNLELALRHAEWDPSHATRSNDRTETALAVNWFFNKHNLKLQSDYALIEDDAAGTTDREARLQFQFLF